MTSRTESTTREPRESRSRKKSWTPPKTLETPEAPAGFKFRWVRHEARGADDSMNVLEKQRQGYELVRKEELPVGYLAQSIEDHEGKSHMTGVVRSGDLVLMRVPEEVVRERTEYFNQRADKMQQAVDKELFKESNKKMPIEQDRQTSVTRGVRPTFEE